MASKTVIVFGYVGIVLGVGVAVGMDAGVGAGIGASMLAAVFVSGLGTQVVFAFLGEGAGVCAVVSAGLSLRGMVLRGAATLWYLPQGLRRLAVNWQENLFHVDSCVPAELMPGSRDEHAPLTFGGLVRSLPEEERMRSKRVVWRLLAVIFFLPAFLYRLSIKATCWFWWPLAYLLKPVPQADQIGRQKQALCWPLDDPMQRLLILVPGVLVLGLVIVEYADFGLWKEFKNSAAVPMPLKVALGMGWGHIPLWHWALILIEAAGLGMLFIAWNARRHRASNNWDGYAQSSMKWDLGLMDKLMRLRSLAAMAFMVLGLGMCLISFPQGRAYVPDAMMLRMERFYLWQSAP